MNVSFASLDMERAYVRARHCRVYRFCGIM
jgi:hypothetical protein